MFMISQWYFFFSPGEGCSFIIHKIQCSHEHVPGFLSLLYPATAAQAAQTKLLAIPSPPNLFRWVQPSHRLYIFCFLYVFDLQIYFQRIVFTNCMFGSFLKQCPKYRHTITAVMVVMKLRKNYTYRPTCEPWLCMCLASEFQIPYQYISISYIITAKASKRLLGHWFK
jgi:hypothetical protein